MAVCTLNIATNERRRDQSGQWSDHTEWHRVVVFGSTADNCAKYLRKGRQVYIEGRLSTRKWTDQEGKDRYTTEVIASNVNFLGGRDGLSDEGTSDYGVAVGQNADYSGYGDSSAGYGNSNSGSSNSGGGDFAFDDDDIPF
jgi:single-strand DNA-binding protein